AGISRAFEHRDWPLGQVHPGGVLETQAEQWMLRLHRRVVDAQPRAFDVLADDGQECRLLAGERDRVVDGVLEEVAELAAGGGGADGTDGDASGEVAIKAACVGPI